MILAITIAGVLCLHPAAAWEDRAIALCLLAAVVVTESKRRNE